MSWKSAEIFLTNYLITGIPSKMATSKQITARGQHLTYAGNCVGQPEVTWISARRG